MKRSEVNRDPERARKRAIADLRTAARKLSDLYREAHEAEPANTIDGPPWLALAASLEAVRDEAIRYGSVALSLVYGDTQ